MAQPLRIADRIETEARQLRIGRLLLAFVTSPLYAFSWLLSKIVKVIWLVLAWAVAAIKVGWQDARR